MTGFGQATAVVDGATISVEVRSLNGRFLDIRTRIPSELSSLETELRDLAKQQLYRGRVELSLKIEAAAGTPYKLDESVVEAYQQMANRAGSLGIEGHLSLDTLFQLPGVLAAGAVDFSSEEFHDCVRKTINEALAQQARARSVEGENLARELQRRLDAIEKAVEKIEPLASDLPGHYRTRLEEKITQLRGSTKVDPSRLAQEVILHAERSDIREELTRLRSHLGRFREVMVSTRKSIGKNLDFLCQELNREMNTIVSKSPLVEISGVAVDGKVEIEKLREQVQNVE